MTTQIRNVGLMTDIVKMLNLPDLLVLNILKYHVSSSDGKVSGKIKTEIIFIFRLHRRPIRLVMLVPVGLSLKF